MKIFETIWWGFWILVFLVILADYWYITAPIVLIVIYLVIQGRREVTKSEREHETKLCAHGVPGGETMQACFKCLEENNWKLSEGAKLDALKDSAFQLRTEEIKRLSSQQLSELSGLYKLDPFDFEMVVARLFEKEGFDTTQTSRSSDGGKDIVAKRGEEVYFVECKRYGPDNLVSTPTLRAFLGTIINERANGGYFVTTSDFNANALQFAKSNNIQAINGEELVQKFRVVLGVSPGSNDYEILCHLCGKRSTHSISESNVALQCVCGNSLKPIAQSDLYVGSKHPPHCPLCKSIMIRRRGKYGDFWGCSSFPSCKGTRNIGPTKRSGKRRLRQRG